MKLTAKNIAVSLGGRRVIAGVDFEASAGEVTVILGQNGSGKTTLLRTLTGELPPQSGVISLNGEHLSHVSPGKLARMRAVLPQSVSLAFPFTVREVVRIGVEAGGGSRHIDHEVDACLARVGLTGYAGRKIQQLSGGEQQRVHLARVLAQAAAEGGEARARWLFLDEPVSSLDLKHQLVIMDMARAFAKQGGGVVAVLHDLNLAAAYADKAVLLSEGEVLAAGSAHSVMTSKQLSQCFDIFLEAHAVRGKRLFVGNNTQTITAEP
jgi:iron complex transport system ATP-binding protein